MPIDEPPALPAEPLPDAPPDDPLLLDPPVPVALPDELDPDPDPPDADDPEPLPIVAFARMKLPPDPPDPPDADAPPAELPEVLEPPEALLDAPDPLPDCRQPVNVMF